MELQRLLFSKFVVRTAHFGPSTGHIQDSPFRTNPLAVWWIRHAVRTQKRFAVGPSQRTPFERLLFGRYQDPEFWEFGEQSARAPPNH